MKIPAFIFTVFLFIIPEVASAKGLLDMLANFKMKSGKTISDIAADKLLLAAIASLPENIFVRYDDVRADIEKGKLEVYGVVVKKKAGNLTQVASIEKAVLNGVDIVTILSGKPTSAKRIIINFGKYKEWQLESNQVISGEISKLTAKNVFVSKKTVMVEHLDVNEILLHNSSQDRKVSNINVKNLVFQVTAKNSSEIKFSNATIDGKSVNNIDEAINYLQK
ncbi:MAG: hypothetical protein KAJ75_04275 [Alphaproteobacteria bacterium]|nr:hypothetical protein [Alphaproteobacteria bacterium]